MASAKGYCDDLTEGKFSFPIIHAIRNSASENNEVLNVLRQRSDVTSLKRQAVAYMDHVTKSFEYTRGFLAPLNDRLHTMLGCLEPRNEAFELILQKITQ